jgi:hypothetical protein
MASVQDTPLDKDTAQQREGAVAVLFAPVGGVGELAGISFFWGRAAGMAALDSGRLEVLMDQ